MTDESIKRVQDGLVQLLAGQNIDDTITACFSIATSSARVRGISKLELQKRLVLLYDKRVSEEKGQASK